MEYYATAVLYQTIADGLQLQYVLCQQGSVSTGWMNIRPSNDSRELTDGPAGSVVPSVPQILEKPDPQSTVPIEGDDDGSRKQVTLDRNLVC